MLNINLRKELDYDNFFKENDKNKIFKVLEYFVYNNIKYSERDIKFLDEENLYEYLLKFHLSNDSYYYKNRYNSNLNNSIIKLMKNANISDNLIYKLMEIKQFRGHNLIYKLSKTTFNIESSDFEYYKFYAHNCNDKEIEKIKAITKTGINNSIYDYKNISLDYFLNNILNKNQFDMIANFISSRENAKEVIDTINFLNNKNLSKKDINIILNVVNLNNNMPKNEYLKLGDFLSNYSINIFNFFNDKEINKLIFNLTEIEFSKIVSYLYDKEIITSDTIIDIFNLLNQENKNSQIIDLFLMYPNPIFIKYMNPMTLNYYYLKFQEELNISNTNIIFEIFHDIDFFKQNVANAYVLLNFTTNPYLNKENQIKLNNLLKDKSIAKDLELYKDSKYKYYLIEDEFKYIDSISINSKESLKVLFNNIENFNSEFLIYDEELYKNNLTYALFLDNCKDEKLLDSFFKNNDCPNMLKYNQNLNESQLIELSNNKNNLIAIINNKQTNSNVIKYIIDKFGIEIFEEIQINIYKYNHNIFERNNAFKIINDEEIFKSNNISIEEISLINKYSKKDLIPILNNNKNQDSLIEYAIENINIDLDDKNLCKDLKDKLLKIIDKKEIEKSLEHFEF